MNRKCADYALKSLRKKAVEGDLANAKGEFFQLLSLLSLLTDLFHMVIGEGFLKLCLYMADPLAVADWSFMEYIIQTRLILPQEI